MELVVLVDEHDNPIGTAPKDTVHTQKTLLHRAFSLFLFDSHNQLILTKRSSKKKAFPGVWTNTVCGHVSPDETRVEAAVRRLREELGIADVVPREVAPYRYQFTDANGIMENEICPILVGTFDGSPIINPLEVDEWKKVSWHQFLEEIKTTPGHYSPWCEEEALILQQTDPALQ